MFALPQSIFLALTSVFLLVPPIPLDAGETLITVILAALVLFVTVYFWYTVYNLGTWLFDGADK